MNSCFGCGEGTFEFETINMYKVTGTHEQNHVFSSTKTTNYNTTYLNVPYCSTCKKKMNIFYTFSSLGLLISISFIYYLWHLYFPNFFSIKGLLFPLIIVVIYLAVLVAINTILSKTITTIIKNGKFPSDHPEIKKLKSDSWKEGLQP